MTKTSNNLTFHALFVKKIEVMKDTTTKLHAIVLFK